MELAKLPALSHPVTRIGLCRESRHTVIVAATFEEARKSPHEGERVHGESRKAPCPGHLTGSGRRPDGAR